MTLSRRRARSGPRTRFVREGAEKEGTPPAWPGFLDDGPLLTGVVGVDWSVELPLAGRPRRCVQGSRQQLWLLRVRRGGQG
jgi:hypothetical protein